MKKFEAPELEIEKFKLVDVLTTSVPTETLDPGDEGLPVGP